jgi:hypothetical protein
MGDVLATLMGGPAQQTDASGIMVPNAGMTEGVMGFPSVARGPLTNPPIVSPTDNQNSAVVDPVDEAVTVQGDAWKPRKQTILGALADAFLVSKGGKPMYTMMRDQRNVNEALKGYQSDPDKALRRLMSIPGHEEDALKLLEQRTDNTRADRLLERQEDSLARQQDNDVWRMIGGMMNIATPETWTAMRDRAIARADARNVEVRHLIPPEYDPDAARFMVFGEVKPKDQLTLEERDRNNTERREIQRDRLEETGRHNQVTEGQARANEAGRNARDNDNVNKPVSKKTLKERFGNKAIRSPDGKRTYEFDATGTLMKQTDENGKVRFFRMGLDGKPVYVRDGK